MESSIIDPHNHAPEVSPDDVWGDAEVLQPNHGGAATVLPPKRSKPPEGTSAAPTGWHREGLRIESIPQRKPADDTERRLEVQKIDGRVVRLDPEIPAAPKVPRQITFHERPPEIAENPLRRGENKEWGHARQQSLRWILGTGVGVATLVVVAMMLLPFVNQSNAARPPAPQSGLVLDEEEHIEGIDALNDMLAKQSEAEQIFRTYASTSITDEILPLVRDPKAMEPLIRTRQRPAMVSNEWRPSEQTTWNVFNENGLAYGILDGTLPDFSKFSAYFSLTQQQLHLDWKATTAYGTATFDDLAKQQGDPSEIRAKLTRADFYTAVFPEEDFQSYQLISSDDSKVVWCYSRRGEEPDGALAKLFASGEIVKSTPEPKKVTLRLAHGPANSLPNQWLIAEMLHKDWISP